MRMVMQSMQVYRVTLCAPSGATSECDDRHFSVAICSSPLCAISPSPSLTFFVTFPMLQGALVKCRSKTYRLTEPFKAEVCEKRYVYIYII